MTTKIPTPTIDAYEALGKQSGGGLLQAMFMKSKANQMLYDRETQALADAELAKAPKAAARALAAMPHHKRLEELRAQHPMLADAYAQNHRYWLDLEEREVEGAVKQVEAALSPPKDEPPPQAA